jgi:hypothetical protein
VVLLHADTWLPPTAGAAISGALEFRRSKVPVVGGGFLKGFRDAPWIMRGARFRSWAFVKLTGVVLGDQAMFVRRRILEQIGGVPEVPLMEEFVLCRRLRAVGRLVLLSPSVSTSARRFRRNGVVTTYTRMARALWLYSRSASWDDIRAIYEPPPEVPQKNSPKE